MTAHAGLPCLGCVNLPLRAALGAGRLCGLRAAGAARAPAEAGVRCEERPRG